MELITLKFKVNNPELDELEAYREIGSVEDFRRLSKIEDVMCKILAYAAFALIVLFFVACVAVILWIIVSLFDIAAHNKWPDPVYQPWNAFTLFW